VNEKQTFKPFVSADQKAPELTVTSIIIGLILAVVFGAANAYLGLRVGMTVSASIPSAVISMGVIRVIMKKDSVLENNMVQTIGSAGESLAAGVIFTMPALFMWAQEGLTDMPNLFNIIVIALIGGILGVLFMVPLRVALIVQEHGVLPYPEGMACAEVLLAGEEGGSKSKTVFAGLGISAVYKFIADGLCLFPSEVHFEIPKIRTGVGMDVLPALLSVGYICGPKISSYMLCGGILAWIVLVPLLALFGGNAIVGTATVPIAEMDSFGIWSSYIRYIGAGAVAAGGIISLAKSLPMIVRTFRDAMKGFGKTSEINDRTSQDLPMAHVLIGILICVLAIWLVPAIEVNLFGAFLIVVFGFFFATVSSRMVGIVGSSNNPVSGMAIATLLFSTIMLKATGNIGGNGMVSAITIGTVICIVAAMAGDTSQDLKTGYILGATPVKQQVGEILGAVVSAFAIGGTLYLLNSAWSFGSAQLPAPQATLMKLVVEGVMNGNLPWTLILAGAGIAVVVEILGIPVLPFAIGLYLPIHLSTPIMAGGIIRLIFEKKKYKNEETKNNVIQGGVLFTSGMIAGEGLIGILLAVFAIIPFAGGTLGDFINISEKFSIGNIGGLVFFALLILLVAKFTVWNKKNEA
jgi:putative OPT family oligopeptide transporter